jgi:feruloyl esterase
MFNRLVMPGVLAFMGMAVQLLPARQSCEKLADLKLPHASITSSLLVPAGTVPGAFGNVPPIPVPARCLVKAVARRTSHPEIRFEVWLPAVGWHGRYQQVGNGGWAGAIPAQSLAYAIRR